MGLTVERLHELLKYDPETGQFTWKKPPKNRPAWIGKLAGCRSIKRYLHITIDKRYYLAHRLAWLHYYGRLPRGWIDHVNHDCFDNRIANLREATTQESAHNRRGDKDSKTGIKGVVPRRGGRAFEANIMCAGKAYYLGQFPTQELAAAAYAEAAQRLHRGFASP